MRMARDSRREALRVGGGSEAPLRRFHSQSFHSSPNITAQAQKALVLEAVEEATGALKRELKELKELVRESLGKAGAGS